MVLTVKDDAPEYFVTQWQLSDSAWPDSVDHMFYLGFTVPAYAIIELLPCPVGFELTNGVCNCSTYIKKNYSQLFH